MWIEGGAQGLIDCLYMLDPRFNDQHHKMKKKITFNSYV